MILTLWFSDILENGSDGVKNCIDRHNNTVRVTAAVYLGFHSKLERFQLNIRISWGTIGYANPVKSVVPGSLDIILLLFIILSSRMEMVGKIARFVVLCMVVVAPHAEALTCGRVQSVLAPCLPYLQGHDPLRSCCGGVKGLLGTAKTPADRKIACTCLKSAVNAIKSIDAGKAAGLPSACGVNIPYKINPSTDCSKSSKADQCFTAQYGRS
ncbi:hypothetical protein RND71_003746 [Anisodus tanguticus]|uniref:Non-specific lipid-transfer protein n=1 Tax=Anisodus tanguticus TaxID=243964 RepID=A0AAE1SX86_9SOLA|nr:hypothetical protein RND71_003746 [Anisodus tanguticus]